MGRWIAIVLAALLAGLVGLVLSIGLEGPGAFSGTAIGRWFGERAATVPNGTGGVASANIGENVGKLVLADVDGRPFPLPQGRPVLVNVWASWCVPCREEMPLLSGFALAQGERGVAVVGIAEDSAAAVRDYLRRTPVNYPVVLDDAQWQGGTMIGNRMGVLPFSALIDGQGRLVKRQYGPFRDAQALRDWALQP